MNWIFTIIKVLLALWRGKPSSEVSQEAEKAGSAQAVAKAEETANASQVKAAASGDAAARAVDSDSKLRQYEAADPNNRDG
jgi:hypothetical protein